MITSFSKTMCDFSFRGRSTRKEALFFTIMTLLISLISLTIICGFAMMIDLKINLSTGDISIPYRMKSVGVIPFTLMVATICLYGIFNIWAIIVGSLLAIRRLHDLNYSGVCYWIWISALISFCIAETSILSGFLFYFLIGGIIILLSAKSFPMPNKYGKVNYEEIIFDIEKQHG